MEVICHLKGISVIHYIVSLQKSTASKLATVCVTAWNPVRQKISRWFTEWSITPTIRNFVTRESCYAIFFEAICNPASWIYFKFTYHKRILELDIWIENYATDSSTVICRNPSRQKCSRTNFAKRTYYCSLLIINWFVSVIINIIINKL